MKRPHPGQLEMFENLMFRSNMTKFILESADDRPGGANNEFRDGPGAPANGFGGIGVVLVLIDVVICTAATKTAKATPGTTKTIARSTKTTPGLVISPPVTIISGPKVHRHCWTRKPQTVDGKKSGGVDKEN